MGYLFFLAQTAAGRDGDGIGGDAFAERRRRATNGCYYSLGSIVYSLFAVGGAVNGWVAAGSVSVG